MANQITEVIQTGWLKRIGQSIKGIFFGLLLFIGSFILLYMNDGRVDISEIAKTAAVINVDDASGGSGAQGELVSLTGDVISDTQLGDEEYLKPGDYLALKRNVEMYAWIEDVESDSTTNTGGSTTQTKTYTYRMDWTRSPQNSSSFKDGGTHLNPELTISESSEVVETAKVGVYEIEMHGITMRGYESVVLTEENVKVAEEINEVIDTDGDGLGDHDEEKHGTDPQLTDSDGDGLSDREEIEVYGTSPVRADTDGDNYTDTAELEGGYNPLGEGELSEGEVAQFEIKKASLRPFAPVLDERSPEDLVRLEDGYLFRGVGTVNTPSVGDVRISFEAAKTGRQYTAFGALEGESLVVYTSKKANVHSLYVGSRAAALETMHQEYLLALWILRFVGFILMWFGLMMVFSPLSVLLDVLPMFGSVSRSAVAGLTFIVCLPLTILVIILSRLLHNPIGIFIAIALTGIGGFFVIKKGKAKTEPTQQVSAPPPPAA